MVGREIKTNSLSNNQGVHTTSISSLYEAENGLKIIDSPGMRDIELADYSINQINLTGENPPLTQKAAAIENAKP